MIQRAYKNTQGYETKPWKPTAMWSVHIWVSFFFLLFLFLFLGLGCGTDSGVRKEQHITEEEEACLWASQNPTNNDEEDDKIDISVYMKRFRRIAIAGAIPCISLQSAVARPRRRKWMSSAVFLSSRIWNFGPPKLIWVGGQPGQ